MSIPPRFKDDLRNRLTLSEVVGRRVRLSRAGREFKGCCPFHHEKTPSFYVNDDKQFYHCFGCGAHGDVIGFVMQHDNLSFPDAIEMLAAEAGMQVPKQSPQEVEQARREKSLYTLMEDAAKFFIHVLHHGREGAEGLSYMRGRGVTDEQLHAFRIGFAPPDGQALGKHLLTLSYTDAQMIEAGLLRVSTRGTEPYAFFRDRVMFPVPDRRGRVVAFGGRILPEHMRPPDRGDFKPPKYINSSDTPLFHKGAMLYGEPRARQAAAEGKPLIVVEGYLDVMAAVSAGYPGALAPLGTALTEEQILALWKMIPDAEKVPVLCFDGDEAGRRAAARACERVLPLLKPGQSVRLAFLPDGEDPDSLIRGQGAAAFAAVIEAAMPLADFIWVHHTAGKNFATPESRAGLSSALEAEALKIADREVQMHYRSVFRTRIGNAFFKRNAGAKGGAAAMANRPAGEEFPVRRPALGPAALQARIALAAVANHPALLAGFEEEVSALDLHDPGFSSLREAIMAAFHAEPGLDRDALHSHLHSTGCGGELARLLGEGVYIHAGFARPEAGEDQAREGLSEALAFLQRKGFLVDVRAAGKALGGDCTRDNEDRMFALLRGQEG